MATLLSKLRLMVRKSDFLMSCEIEVFIVFLNEQSLNLSSAFVCAATRVKPSFAEGRKASMLAASFSPQSFLHD